MRRNFTIVVSSSCSSRNSLKMDGAGKLSRWVHFFLPSVQTISQSRKCSMDAKNVFCNLELELRWGLPEEDHCQDRGYWVTAYVEPWKFQNFTKFSTETGRPNGENKTSNLFQILNTFVWRVANPEIFKTGIRFVSCYSFSTVSFRSVRLRTSVRRRMVMMKTMGSVHSRKAAA